MKIKIKICGITNIEDAIFCDQSGIDFIGLNFVKTSKRFIDINLAKKICKQMKTTKLVGVFVDENIEKINEIAEMLNLDYIQMHGNENPNIIKKSIKPIIKAFRIDNEMPDLKKFELKNIDYFLFDGQKNGYQFNHNLLQNTKINRNFFMAGGINTNNMLSIIKTYNPFCIDIASSIEKSTVNMAKNHKKILALIDIVSGGSMI